MADLSAYIGTANLNSMPKSNDQIIPYYKHPHVHTVIIDDTYYEETVAQQQDPNDLPYSTVVVTGADKGIDNKFIRINKKEVKDLLFGKSNFDKYGQPSIQADVLFNGSTNVWFCRVLPDNATYANVILMMHYRKGKILDDLNQETGKYRLEVKYSLEFAQKPKLVNGAIDDDDIMEYANSLATTREDPLTGYISVPLLYVRSIGRGKYGNAYSFNIDRDINSEKENGVKMYKFNILETSDVTRRIMSFTGSLYQTARYDSSTLISDVMDQEIDGTYPVKIHVFEENFQQVYDYYQDRIVNANMDWYKKNGFTQSEAVELNDAVDMQPYEFDPLFGAVINDKLGNTIPFYKNYTNTGVAAYREPNLVVNTSSERPLNINDWTAAAAGATVLVLSDPLQGGLRWEYTIINIDEDTGTIQYDEGHYSSIDADQYDGVNVSHPVGMYLIGGHDGDFEEVAVNGEIREPNSAEMKVLLAREYVKAFKGEKDRKILSPARTTVDFIFDANYNLNDDANTVIPTSGIGYLYSTSTVLTDEDGRKLGILKDGSTVYSAEDINVKRAMYELNAFRNVNGMNADLSPGAGCYLYLDCGITGLKNTININYELLDILAMVEDFQNRNCGVDLGYYDIYEPNTGKRVTVTATYYIAKHLVNHLMLEGINRPFVRKWATMTSVQKSKDLTVTGEMIRDSFRPDLDLIDWDVKEALYSNRINYWITEDEGRKVYRGTQNTRQLDASALLEENNVRVLNTFKKEMEKDCAGYLYEWNDPTVRQSYTDAEMNKFRPWIGPVVEDLNIEFSANEFEQNRMMMHCKCYVKFREIVKRIILEINIQRPSYATGGGE